MKKLIIIGLLAFPAMAWAQDFKATGKLEKVSQDGFYKISLSPDESSFISDGFTNVRVLDANNTEVPYIFSEEKPVYLQQQFREYDILEKKQVAKAFTSIKLHNPRQASIDNISLLIKNAEVLKTARLSGSDDGTTWFSVKDKFSLNTISNPNAVNELRGIEFPLTNYTYYLLEISDSTTSPINILKAGYYDVSVTNGLYTEIANTAYALTTETANKKTLIRLKFKEPQILDKIELTLEGSPFFQRSGFVSHETVKKIKKRVEKFDLYLEDFIVRSGQTAVINLNAFKTDNLTFAIENGDNPPLRAKEFKPYQLNRYLIAWLKKDEPYTIRFGKESDLSPDYDLEFFRDSIPAQIQTLRITDVKPVETAAISGSPTFFTSKAIIWVAIAGVIILLGFMSIRLVRETNARKKDS